MQELVLQNGVTYRTKSEAGPRLLTAHSKWQVNESLAEGHAPIGMYAAEKNDSTRAAHTSQGSP